MASQLDPFSRKLNYRCGAPGYTAPEVLNDLSYDTQADVFSVGAIMFALLTRRALFTGKDTNEIVMKNKACRIEPTSSVWCKIKSKARNLLLNLLKEDPNERFTAAQALDHSWF
jgi:serine/threonine protein kinase